MLSAEALEREVEVSALVHHSAYRRILGRAPQLVALEHVEGVPLFTHLAEATSDRAREVVIQILRALHALHAAGRVHGDLKPEHLLIDGAGHLRVIDLGLSLRIGEPARGGTHGYLAPELLCGAPLTPASDLYALGKVLEQTRITGALEAFVASASATNVEARPSSAHAALLSLGALSANVPPAIVLPTELLALFGAGGGRIVLVDVPRGGGASTIARTIAAHAHGRGRSAVLLPARSGMWLDVARLIGTEASSAERAIAKATTRLSDDGRPIVIDGATALDDDEVAATLVALRALSASGRGAVFVLGGTRALQQAVVQLGGELVALSAASVAEAQRILSAHGAPASNEAARTAHALTGGLRGALGRLAEAWCEAPEASAMDVWSSLQGGDEPDPVASDRSVSAIDALIQRGAPRRALALLGDDRATDDLAVSMVRARAEVAAGKLDDALVTLRAAEQMVRLDATVELEIASLLERLGRHAEARAEAERAGALPCATVLERARAAAVIAQCALVLGDPRGALEVATTALTLLDDRSDAHALRSRLLALASDAALRRAEASSALELAERSLRAAAQAKDPLVSAHATARIAAAHQLQGRAGEARRAWQAALAFVVESGDVAALPPYVMNLATADHATFHVAEAIAGYQRAQHLAARLGRRATEISARTNLGGLFGMLGADHEALLVLDEAERLARGPGPTPAAPLYVAQSQLLAAEVLARRDPEAARARLTLAEAGLSRVHATRQLLEARLLRSEIDMTRAPGQARAFVNEHRGELEGAGLSGRALLLAGRAARAEGELDAARAAFEAARDECAGEPDLSAQAKVALAEIHARLGTGAEAQLAEDARRAVGELAARVPPGLRDAYLRAPERRVPERAVVRSSAGLGDAGRRLLSLVSRVLLPTDERHVLEAALDEAVALTRAERAFLLLRREGKRPEVMAARNLDRESIKKGRFRFSKSVAERVLETGEPLVTASATEDPALMGSRSVLDLGLRSILVVPVRAKSGVTGALYVDHRFETARFGDDDREMMQALADVIGLALENARLHREANVRAEDLRALSESLRAEALERDAELMRLSAELERAPATHAEGGIVGRSPALKRALDLAAKVAGSELGVAIEGESGTGKELFARYIHDKSARKTGPLVALNCGALPESILESELFGHVRGAFTGAVRDHAGVFRAAAGGTVFLDEIGEMPLSAQARLLRVLEAREVLPVGGNRPVPIDVRVVCATNKNLAAEVEAGRFRRDLFFRLVSVSVHVPPLRERKDDLVALSTALLDRIRSEPGMGQKSLSPAALRALLAHDWPGNVRELLQTLRRAVAVAEGEVIEPADLGLVSAGGAPLRDARRTLDRQMVERALQLAGGSRTRAAEALGVTRVTLHRAMKRLEVKVPVKRGRPRTSG